jgi:hypothetical protein
MNDGSGRRVARLETLWKRARAWAAANGIEHSCHGVQGVAPL